MSQLLSNFGVDWKLLLAQAVNFAILLYLLKRFAYTPVLTMLQKRQGIVRKGLEDAHNAEKSLSDAQYNADAVSADAKQKARILVEEANTQSQSFILSAKNQAEVERSRILAQTKLDAEALRQESEKGLEKKTVEHIVAGIRAILQEEVTADMNGRIIERLTQSV